MFILASKSPRRRELLSMLGLEFEVMTADIDESVGPGLTPGETVAQICRNKARAISALHPDRLVLAADTIVVVDDRILGKPRSEDEACAMLRLLSGRRHTVMTGYCLQRGEQTECHVEETHLCFRSLAPAEIDSYVATGSPMDKAGAYGIQDQAGCFVEAMEGDYYNVMGLPLCSLTKALRRWGVPVLGTVEP